MAVVVHELILPTPAGVPRATSQVTLPQGAEILGLGTFNGAATLIIRGDNGAAGVAKTFVAVRADVALLPAEAAAAYVGSFTGYVRAAGMQPDIYHVLAL